VKKGLYMRNGKVAKKKIINHWERELSKDNSKNTKMALKEVVR
jgi:hypothetical protein